MILEANLGNEWVIDSDNVDPTIVISQYSFTALRRHLFISQKKRIKSLEDVRITSVCSWVFLLVSRTLDYRQLLLK